MGVAIIKGKTNNWAFTNWEHPSRVLSLLHQMRKVNLSLVYPPVYGEFPEDIIPVLKGRLLVFLGYPRMNALSEESYEGLVIA
jgi:hypothetical protein